VTSRDKDAEIKEVATRLDGLLDDLAATVAALNAIMIRPAPPILGADEERLAAP
jgi:hypothetical protein